MIKDKSSANAKKDDFQSVNNLVSELDRMLPNFMASLTGMQFKSHRDFYTIFGWERQVSATLCRALYENHGIAKVANDVPIDTTWRNLPKITSGSTDFDSKLTTLNNRIDLFGAMKNVDRISGIGRYGIMVLGIAGQSYESALKKFKLDQLKKIDVYQESEINLDVEQKKGKDGKTESYYSIKNYVIGGKRVHPSRIIHVAENSLDGIFGQSRLIPIYNQLHDMWKISGSSAEQFYMSASLLLSAQGRKDYRIKEADGTALKEKLLELVNRAKGFLVSNGFDIKNIAPDIVSPKDSWEVHEKFISASRRIPRRILFGSEMGQLASSQDQSNYYEHIESRQKNYVNPKIIRPVIEVLLAYSDLNATAYEVAWDKLSSLTDKEVAISYHQYADSIKKLKEAGVDDSDLYEITIAKMKELIKSG